MLVRRTVQLLAPKPGLLMQFPGSHITTHHVDMADYGSVKEFANRLLSSNKPIDMLFNNAARFLDAPQFEVTKDGYEATVGA